FYMESSVMKKGLIVIATVVSLVGCSARVVKSFDNKELSVENYAIVKGVEDDYYTVMFSEYALLDVGQKPDVKTVGDPIIGYPDELHLLPGSYYINVRCVAITGMGKLEAWPSARMKLEAGSTYELECNDVGENKISLELTSKYQNQAASSD
ncbi:hypothetical protein ACVD4U_004251, partial [Vibrio vulnificus]